MTFESPAMPLRPEPDTELVIGLVGAVGTDLQLISRIISNTLKKYDYQTEIIRLSNLLRHLDVQGLMEIDDSSEFQRISTLMTAGNQLNEGFKTKDALALCAASAIFKGRDIDAQSLAQPRPRKSYLIRSLKRPDEVNALRWIYGSGFFLIGVYASEKTRIDHLRARGISSDDELRQLMRRDENEDSEFGQKTRDTFQLADVFVRLNPAATSDSAIERFFELLFGYPHHSPTEDEHPMFLAYSSALRSGDLSRQVGAVIVSSSGDIIGVGANDVPRHGGGLCWPGANDYRDHVKGFDSNEKTRDQLLLDIVKISIEEIKTIADQQQANLQQVEGILAQFKEQATSSNQSYKKARLFDITEYGRAVHAEMEAILACARAGTSTLGSTLFVTTFPCHNCAKHIIDAGIRRVIYIEPYPKSRALDLYQESIDMDDGDVEGVDGNAIRRCDGRVRFSPFVGIGPRRYIDFFSMTLGSGYPLIRKSRELKGNKNDEWRHGTAHPRIPMSSLSYLQREHHVSKLLLDVLNHFETPDDLASQ